MRAPPDPSAGPQVAYLTDIEGLWSKLVTFAEDNPLVSLDTGGRLQVAPGALFVFGGDAIDRGPEARRVVSTLLDARERQPDQVVLLAGNRDINKLRLPRELSGHPPKRTPDEMRGASRPALLRWIFGNTMGAKEAFEQRRAELLRCGVSADDEAVVESFLQDLSPQGELTRYLAACQLAFRAGKTLFVHGSVTEENLGRVPGREQVIDGVDAWVDALNAWYRDQMALYQRSELTAAGEAAWTPLVAYQAPLPGTRLNQSSVVYARPTDDDGNPSLPPPEVTGALLRDGVRRVVVGHSPVGDSPALLRSSEFELLAADNSYSPVEAGTRILLSDDRIESDAVVGLAGGVERVRIIQDFGDDSPIGKRLVEGGFLVKGRLSSGDYLLHRSRPGFQVDQHTISPRELRTMALVEARRG